MEGQCLLIVTSAGRTGTKYFGDRLGEMIPESFSVHEPDVIMGLSRESMTKIRSFGLYQTVLGKLLRTTGIRNLSMRYLNGTLNVQEVTKAIVRQRLGFYRSVGHRLIIESYSGWFGVLPAVPRLGLRCKVLVIVRDPRTWLRSNMNWGTMYGPRDVVGKLGLGRLTPHVINDEAYAMQWRGFSRFQKLCWAWLRMNEIMLDYVESGASDARVVRFEDVFEADNRKENLEEILRWSTAYPRVNFDFHVPEGILERRANENISDAFPPWENWNVHLQKEMRRICGPLMGRLGYG